MAPSGQLLAVTNRTAESWWLFLANSWSLQIVLPSLGGSFWPTLGRNKSQCWPSLCGYFWTTLSRPRVRFVSFKSWPEKATKTRQCHLLRTRVGQKKPPRLGSTICYGQTWVRKSHQDSVTATRKSHQDSAVRFVTTKSWPGRATETRQYDLLRRRVVQKESPRLGSTICYGQELARKSHQDSAVRFVTAKSWPERATKTRQYDLLRPNVGQKEPLRLGSTICYGQQLARKSHRDSAVRVVTAKLARKSHQDSAVRFVTAKSWPEKAAKTRQYDLLRLARKSH